MIGHLESRENELFYENRELRDLVGVLASRMFRFSHFIRQPNSPNYDEETSLDGSADEAEGEGGDGDQVIDYYSSSSEEGM